MMRRPIKRPARRRDKTAPVYTLFYSAAGIAIALLIYASFVFSRSPPELAGSTEKPRPVAMIRLNQTDGKGRCRQVAFDNISGRFEEARAGPCPNLIPEELLVETIRSRSLMTDAFTRAFK
jgi:hypothetical protein